MEFDEVFQDLQIIAIPTLTNFRGITTREIAIFRGPHGWSEFSPFVEYGQAEAATWMRAAIEAAYRPWPTLVHHRIPINATMPRVAPDRVSEILSRFDGVQCVKFKVKSFVEDAATIAEVISLLPQINIRIDVNAGWDRETALAELSQFHSRFGDYIDYVEQPCRAIEDLAEIKARLPLRIAVDESIRKHLGTQLSELRNVADVAIIKWAPSGGFIAAQALIDEIGLDVVISSALDSSIGISHGLALAGSLKSALAPCGLATVGLLNGDVTHHSLLVRDGYIEVRPIEPDAELLLKYRAQESRVQWWQNRMRHIWEQELNGELGMN